MPTGFKSSQFSPSKQKLRKTKTDRGRGRVDICPFLASSLKYCGSVAAGSTVCVPFGGRSSEEDPHTMYTTKDGADKDSSTNKVYQPIGFSCRSCGGELPPTMEIVDSSGRTFRECPQCRSMQEVTGR